MNDCIADRPAQRPHVVTLNPQGVLSPALTAMRDSLEMISISLHALTDADLKNIPVIPYCFNNFRFTAPEDEDPTERRAVLTRWLLTKGFQELVRGIHQTLEEAYLYATLLQMKDHVRTFGDLETVLPRIRKKAADAKFPKLLGLVNKGLAEPLLFEAECLSLQKVRNCLEHRAGIVGTSDTKGDDALRLVLPVLKVFVVHNGEEVELQYDMGEERRVEAGQSIYIRRGSRELSYKLGERISLTPADYQEIIQACWIFVSDLAEKLPRKAT